MIELLSESLEGLSAAMIAELGRYRHQVFIEKLGWDVVSTSRVRDQEFTPEHEHGTRDHYAKNAQGKNCRPRHEVRECPDGRSEGQAATQAAALTARHLVAECRCQHLRHVNASGRRARADRPSRYCPDPGNGKDCQRCHFWGEAVRGRGAQPLGGWEARVSGPGGFEKGGHPPSACAVTRTGRSPG